MKPTIRLLISAAVLQASYDVAESEILVRLSDLPKYSIYVKRTESNLYIGASMSFPRKRCYIIG